MSALDVIEIVAGAVLVLGALVDVFQTVVLPRPAIGLVRVARFIYPRMWRLWRAAWGRMGRLQSRETMLAVFGPLSVLVLLAFWGLAILFGYALIYHGLADQLRPQPDGFATYVYFSALSLCTVGFGDFVPVGTAARALVVTEAATGLGLVALVISLLFQLFSSFQRREAAVVALDALAGAPPSGLQLLDTCARYDMPQQLEKTFEEWRIWTAEVLESHLAYPILVYFRSSHDNEAWLNSFGAVMDAALLVLTSIEGGPRGAAHLTYKVGNHLMEDLGWFFGYHGADGSVGIELEEYQAACGQLRDAGYRVNMTQEGWEKFSRLRMSYASIINRLARYLAIPPAPWISDRSYIPHRDVGARRARAQRGRRGTRV